MQMFLQPSRVRTSPELLPKEHFESEGLHESKKSLWLNAMMWPLIIKPFYGGKTNIHC